MSNYVRIKSKAVVSDSDEDMTEVVVQDDDSDDGDVKVEIRDKCASHLLHF